MRRIVAVFGLALLLATYSPAAAVPVGVSIPTATAPPGGITLVSIELDRDLVGLGVIAIDYRLALDPAVISAASFVNDGLVLTWGPPFQNITPTMAAVSAGGAAPVTSDSRRVHQIQVVVAAGCPLGDYPLNLTLVRFNGGEPSASIVNGVLQVRSGVDAPPPAAGTLAIGAIAPNPARGATRLAFRLPAGDPAPATLVVHALDGRRVRVLASGVLPGGEHERLWDLRDARGMRVAPGVYFVRLTRGGAHVERRISVVR